MEKEKKDLRVITIQVTPEQHQEWKRLADIAPLNRWCRKIIESYVEQQQKAIVE